MLLCATKIIAAHYTITHDYNSCQKSRKQHGVTLNFLKSSTHVAQLGIFKNHSLQTISQYHFLKSFDFFKKKKTQNKEKKTMSKFVVVLLLIGVTSNAFALQRKKRGIFRTHENECKQHKTCDECLYAFPWKSTVMHWDKMHVPKMRKTNSKGGR